LAVESCDKIGFGKAIQVVFVLTILNTHNLDKLTMQMIVLINGDMTAFHSNGGGVNIWWRKSPGSDRRRNMTGVGM
jgi:hypothetical protein